MEESTLVDSLSKFHFYITFFYCARYDNVC